MENGGKYSNGIKFIHSNAVINIKNNMKQQMLILLFLNYAFIMKGFSDCKLETESLVPIKGMNN